jgi:phosphinothricin acetyltransferase
MIHYTTRPAHPTDAPVLTTIYNQGIADRIATFETRLRTPEELLTTITNPRYPCVVACVAAEVVAFASTSAYRARDCYAGIAEFSVYVAREWRGQGAGTVVMQALLQAAQQAGFWKVLSRVFVENSASRRMLAHVGFREVGIYEAHAQLDGVWRDVVIVEKRIAEK